MPAPQPQLPAALWRRSAFRLILNVSVAGPSVRRLTPIAISVGLLAGCMAPAPFERVGRSAPPGAPPGTCWESVIIPARIETITEQVMISEAETSADGKITKPAVFATETRQEITRPREESYFQTLCPDELTPDYISSLQRALAARGLYDGLITATLNTQTRAAIRRYQQELGIDSQTLSLRAARSLGLSAVELGD
ncbi:peptidoglycan-binding domain-containing protein [Tritonibacter sp. AK171]|uniref:peptidoglycan-binding domain-containing protein n=1 Tax=Tritonibacter sp. AK171 TaxID=3048493 RepID=UPI0024C36D19|nr:peptidoglycan-binding domain-containing protein [Tritonibacter sp. AK171]